MQIRQVFLYLFFFISVFVNAQNKQLLYNFTDIPQSLMVNPGAEIQNSAYFGIPALSGIYAGAGSSEISIYDLFSDNGVDFNIKVKNAIYSLNKSDIQRVNEELEILNVGFKLGGLFNKDYISFGIYQELNFFNYWPEDLAILAYEGNAPNIGRPFDLSHLSAKGELLTVFHVGFHRKVDDHFSFGVRGKLYSGVIDVSSRSNSGSFITSLGTDNTYRHTLISDVEIRTSGIASLREDDVDGATDVLNILKNKALLGGNLGVGFDFGVTYKPSKEWTHTASIQDLGFIRQSKDIETYTLKGAYSLEGINLPFNNIITGGGLSDNWQELIDDIEEALPYEIVNSSYTTMRPLKLNLASIYNFGERRSSKECNCATDDNSYINSVGIQFFAETHSRYPQAALTAFYYTRIGEWLKLKTTYTVDKFSKTNIGLGLSTHFANFNFYLLADNLIEYYNLANMNNASLQFGFNYIFPLRH
ncbi:hypothetical protein JM658_04260 [Joostella atrarenae]|uniref:DUF5723 domain-containing protein n=1 Tax=Joostella atrarenae TaxID=679257 RepID=A0ABS9J0R9_9FLAO|nr:DUF5723 family protein [Joostella atrarenae]MCF8714033.1 hypothetical protein [Joostella atrarenae]